MCVCDSTNLRSVSLIHSHVITAGHAATPINGQYGDSMCDDTSQITPVSARVGVWPSVCCQCTTCARKRIFQHSSFPPCCVLLLCFSPPPSPSHKVCVCSDTSTEECYCILHRPAGARRDLPPLPSALLYFDMYPSSTVEMSGSSHWINYRIISDETLEYVASACANDTTCLCFDYGGLFCWKQFLFVKSLLLRTS